MRVRPHDERRCLENRFRRCQEIVLEWKERYEAVSTENSNLRQSCTDLEARSARLFAEVSRLVAAAQEVFNGRDHDTGSSGQVFVDHGSLMALQAAVNAVSGKRDDLDPVSAKALYDNLDELALDDSRQEFCCWPECGCKYFLDCDESGRTP